MPARKAVEGFALDCGFDAKASGEIGLCVNEALANITRHAYGGAGDRPVVLEADYRDDQLIVTLRDWGNGKQPPALPHHDPLTPGGLGLVCLKTLLDEVTYNPQPDGMLLRMMRRKRA